METTRLLSWTDGNVRVEDGQHTSVTVSRAGEVLASVSTAGDFAYGSGGVVGKGAAAPTSSAVRGALYWQELASGQRFLWVRGASAWIKVSPDTGLTGNSTEVTFKLKALPDLAEGDELHIDVRSYRVEDGSAYWSRRMRLTALAGAADKAIHPAGASDDGEMPLAHDLEIVGLENVNLVNLRVPHHIAGGNPVQR